MASEFLTVTFSCEPRAYLWGKNRDNLPASGGDPLRILFMFTRNFTAQSS